ncbi:MAG: response regulator transcription factor [Phenylobacterium sp.]
MVTSASTTERVLSRPPKNLSLSRRQAECLAWVEQGKSAPEIAIILGLSARTVEAYIERACEKLEVRTRIQAVVRARRDGLLDDVLL